MSKTVVSLESKLFAKSESFQVGNSTLKSIIHNPKSTQKGFTIVELLVVIVVIGILAAITIVAYTGVTQKANIAMIRSDLKNAADIIEMYEANNGNYPTDISVTDLKASNNIVLQSATAPSGNFCVNAYYKTDSTLRMSWSSADGGLQDGLCDGATVGNPVGGTVPIAARGTSLAPDFSRWTLYGGAVYDATTKELALGTSGAAESPLIRVDKPAMMNFGGDFYAVVASSESSIAPNGGYHITALYYASDGVTPVKNSWNYVGNGCANGFALGSWNIADTRCNYAGGPLVVYTRIHFSGSSGGYASLNLKIRNPIIMLSD